MPKSEKAIAITICFCQLPPHLREKFPYILDYLYGCWWQCRGCGEWYELVP